MSEHKVVLYSTSVPTLPKVRAGIATIKRILDAKKVEYEEVSAGLPCWCISPDPPALQPFVYPLWYLLGHLPRTQQRLGDCCAGLQVDLTMNPEKREEMLAASEIRTIPQLHVNGQVSYCNCSAVWCRCHRHHLRHRVVRTARRSSAAKHALRLLFCVQFIGDADHVQELEDFGQLDDRLQGQ